MELSRLHGGYSTMSLPAMSASCTSPEPQYLGSEASWATCGGLASPTEHFHIHRAANVKTIVAVQDQANTVVRSGNHGSLQQSTNPGKQSPLATLAATWGVKLPKAVDSSQRLKQVHNVRAVETAWLPEPLSPNTMSPTDTLSAGLSAYKVHLPAGLQSTRRHMVLPITAEHSRSRSAGRLTGHTSGSELKQGPSFSAAADNSAAWHAEPGQVAGRKSLNTVNTSDAYVEPISLHSINVKDSVSDQQHVETANNVRVLPHTDSTASAATPEIVMQLLTAGHADSAEQDNTADMNGHMERLNDELVIDAADITAPKADSTDAIAHHVDVMHDEAYQRTTETPEEQTVTSQQKQGKAPLPTSATKPDAAKPRKTMVAASPSNRSKLQGPSAAYKSYGSLPMTSANKKPNAGKLPQVVKQQRDLRSTAPARPQPLPTIKPAPTQRSNYYPSKKTSAPPTVKDSIAEPSPLLLPALRNQADVHVPKQVASVKPSNAAARLQQKLQQAPQPPLSSEPPAAAVLSTAEQEASEMVQAGQLSESHALTTDGTEEVTRSASAAETTTLAEPCAPEAVLVDECTTHQPEALPSDMPCPKTDEREFQQDQRPAAEDVQVVASLPATHDLDTADCLNNEQEASVACKDSAEDAQAEQPALGDDNMELTTTQHQEGPLEDDCHNVDMHTAAQASISPVLSRSSTPEMHVVEQLHDDIESPTAQLQGGETGRRGTNKTDGCELATQLDPTPLLMSPVTPLEVADQTDSAAAGNSRDSRGLQQSVVPQGHNHTLAEPKPRRASQQHIPETGDISKAKTKHLGLTQAKQQDNKPAVHDQRRQPRAVRDSFEAGRSSIPASGSSPPIVNRARARRGSMPVVPTQPKLQPLMSPSPVPSDVVDAAPQGISSPIAPAMPAYRARRASVPIMPSQMSGFMLMAATKTDVFVEGITAVEPTNLLQIAEVRQAQEAAQVRKKERRKSRLQSNTSSTAGYGPQTSQNEGFTPVAEQQQGLNVYSSALYATSGMLGYQQLNPQVQVEQESTQVEQESQQEHISVPLSVQQHGQQGADAEATPLEDDGVTRMHENIDQDPQLASNYDSSHEIHEQAVGSQASPAIEPNTVTHDNSSSLGGPVEVIPVATITVEANAEMQEERQHNPGDTIVVMAEASFLAECHIGLQTGEQGVEPGTETEYDHPHEQITSAELMAAVMAAEPEVFQEGQDTITSVENNVGNVYPKQARMQTILSDELLAPMPVNPDAFRQSLGEQDYNGYVDVSPPRRKGSKQLKHKSSGRSMHSKASANLESPKPKVRFGDLPGSEVSSAKQSQKPQGQSEAAIDRSYSQALTGFEDVLDDYEWEVGKPAEGNMQNKPETSGGKAAKQERSRLHKSNDKSNHHHEENDTTPEHSSGSQTLAGFEDILESTMFADEELARRHRTNKAHRRRK